MDKKKKKNRRTLEGDAIFQIFKPKPTLIATFDGLKKVKITGLQSFYIVTKKTRYEKLNIIFLMRFEDATQLGKAARINKKIAAQKMRTMRTKELRPKVLNDEMLSEAMAKLVKITMLSGHVFYGTLTDYSRDNILLTVNDCPVLIYKHAVHKFEVGKMEAHEKNNQDK